MAGEQEEGVMGQMRFTEEAPSQARQTSKDAARAVEPHMGRLQEQVLRTIKACGASGATDREIQGLLRMKGSTQRPRRIELLHAGLIEDSGTKRDRSTVWTASEGE